MRKPHLARIICLTLAVLLTNVPAWGRSLRDEYHWHAEHADCVAMLQPVLQKVAFMFLVSGDMPHEAVWTRWFGELRDRLPAGLLCDQEAMQCFQALPRGSTNEVYDSQHFYTLYVHTKPDFPGYPEGSLFHKRVINTLLPTAWGDYSLAAALRLLIAEALRDPFNQRFHLICPATIPLYPPLVVYTQLMAQNRSRVNWFAAKDGPFYNWASRFPLTMYEDFPEIDRHTRFNRQFVTLTRKHAQIIAEDDIINPLFEKHCFIAREQHGHFCIADEQYVGTALSYILTARGEDITEEVMGDIAVAMARSGGGFDEDMITEELLVQLRGASGNMTLLPEHVNYYGVCVPDDRLNITVGRIDDAQEVCSHFEAKGGRDEPMVPFELCHLFARKFFSHTSERLWPLLETMGII